MLFDGVDVVSLVSGYLGDLPSEVLAGNVFAVTLVLISLYLTILLINQLTGLIIFLLKKVVLLVIVGLAYHKFLLFLFDKIVLEGWTQDNMLLGFGGSLVGFFAVAAALYAAFHSVRGAGSKAGEKIEDAGGKAPQGVGAGLRDFVSDSFQDNRSIGALLAYLIVAQFGVFSSKTISAPTPNVGLVFFIAFMLAAFFFIRQNYKDIRRGLKHLAVAFSFGLVLSIVLGTLWGNMPLSQLLSMDYFATDSLVAFITGIALSLFMGTKN